MGKVQERRGKRDRKFSTNRSNNRFKLSAENSQKKLTSNQQKRQEPAKNTNKRGFKRYFDKQSSSESEENDEDDDERENDDDAESNSENDENQDELEEDENDTNIKKMEADDEEDSSLSHKRSKFEIRIPKIILRNLSFKTTEEMLKTSMEKHGQVDLVSIPRKPDGKMFGYGFVVFRQLNDAAKAINALNTTKLYGNTVAADWCLPKNLFLKNQQVQQANEEAAKKRELNAKKQSRSDEDEDEDDDEDDEDDKDKEDSGSDEDDAEDNKDEDDDEEDDVSDSEDESSDAKKKRLKSTKSDENSSKKDDKIEKKKQSGTQDVQEERTVFIRNLGFDVTVEALKEAFSKFGPIKSAFICMDKELERPRGTAFVQFENRESAVSACAESEMFELDLRRLQIDMALPRTRVNTIVEEKKTKVPSDNRNLALAKEGRIYPNSYEAEGISKADMMRRQKIEAESASKLKLLHYFVSPTRLSVHNIPIKCTDDELKRVFIKALYKDDTANDKKHKFSNRGILRCRIMRDLTRLNSDGIGRSKGFGFIDFINSDLARRALHATNNNPKLFPNNSTRLIVQFSIEDMRALKKKQKRVEKSRVKVKAKQVST